MTDRKVLAAWNGLMISGLARGYQALGDEAMLVAAVRGAKFLRDKLIVGSRVRRRWMDGEAAHGGVLDDYAYVVAAFLDLYESTFDPDWLAEALRLNETVLDLFYDAEKGAFFYTSREGEELIARGKPIMDNARPSGNATMVFNLLRIAEFTGDKEMREKADTTVKYFGAKLHEAPLGVSTLLNAVDFRQSNSREIFIAGDLSDPATKSLIEAVWRDPDRNRVLALVTPGIEKLLPPAAGKIRVGGKPAAYVCRNFACEAPVTDPAQLAASGD